MAKRINFWELPVEDAQPDDTLPAYRGRGEVARVRVPTPGGGGTVTSVGVSMPTGFSVANSPVTSSGTITVTFTAGYGLPTTAKQGQWDTAYSWGNHALAGYALASAVTSALAGKVDKVAGKGLSTEDYTTAEKSKLAGIEAGAQVNTVISVAGKTGAVTLTKADVGLGNVDNTSDADKPISTAVSAALSGKVDTTDTRLADAREWNASTVSQAEAEAGTATTRRAWTAQRVWQAITAWWNASAAKSKLDGIQAGATANQTDAYLLNRANHTGTQAASTITGLATVATTGSYNDLTDKPTIPAAQVPADWNATSGVARILNKPSLGTAASANAGDFATAAQGAKADTAFGWGNHASAGYAPLTSPQFSGTPAAQRIVLESAAPSNPNDSNSWADGVSMVQHATQGWAPENYIGVLHAGINVNRAFQLTVGANGFYVRRIHSSATNAQWQTVWTDKNFNPSNYVTTAAMQAYTYDKATIDSKIDAGGGGGEETYPYHGVLTTENLNDVRESGVYGQPSTPNATPARNYPAQIAGALEVLVLNSDTTPFPIVTQRYTTNEGTQRIFIRRGGAQGGWNAWREITIGAGSMAFRDLTVSTSPPSGTVPGQVWFQVES